MIVKYAKVNPVAPFGGTYQDPCEWVWTDDVSKVVHMGILDEVPFGSHYRYTDLIGDAPFRFYMLLHGDDSGKCDLVGLGIHDRVEAYILSDDGKTVDRL